MPRTSISEEEFDYRQNECNIWSGRFKECFLEPFIASWNAKFPRLQLHHFGLQMEHSYAIAGTMWAIVIYFSISFPEDGRPRLLGEIAIEVKCLHAYTGMYSRPIPYGKYYAHKNLRDETTILIPLVPWNSIADARRQTTGHQQSMYDPFSKRVDSMVERTFYIASQLNAHAGFGFLSQ